MRTAILFSYGLDVEIRPKSGGAHRAPPGASRCMSLARPFPDVTQSSIQWQGNSMVKGIGSDGRSYKEAGNHLPKFLRETLRDKKDLAGLARTLRLFCFLFL